MATERPIEDRILRNETLSFLNVSQTGFKGFVVLNGGWSGKLLRVDLTESRWWEVSSEPHATRFIGGIGTGLKITWDEVASDTGAFDPKNRLVFAPGPLTGTPVPGSGRFEMVSVSPRS